MLPRNFNIKGRGRPTRRTVTKMMPKTPEQGEPSYYSSLFYRIHYEIISLHKIVEAKSNS